MRRFSSLLLLSAFSVLTAASCQDQAANAAPASVSARPERPKFRKGKVHIQSSQGGELSMDVEIAENDPQRMHGLMFKEKLGDGEGMLFIFERPDVHYFWMKNTLIPLDMMFLGEDRRVLGIYENATPLSLERMGVGNKPSLYVLEVNAGWSRKHGVGAGSQLRFEGVE